MAATLAAVVSGFLRFLPIGVSATPVAGPSTLMDVVFWGLVVFIIFLTIVAVLQTREKYLRATYDPSLALRYWEAFEKMRETGARRKAALTLRNYKDDLDKITKKRHELAPIDPVLDLFEDIGFYLRGHQISDEVVHHFFQRWIRGYYLTAKPYLIAWQNKEPAKWEHWPSLFDAVQYIEREREKKSGKPGGEQEDLDAFLIEEIGDELHCPTCGSSKTAARPDA
jgi:hypothetical protein